MDPFASEAARALRAGDPLAALRQVALRRDPPALLLRGIALAQLGDLAGSRRLLQRAHRAFGPGERLARARCATALAEVALAARDPRWPAGPAEAAARTFAERGERGNEQHARLLTVRRLILLGRLAEAERALARIVLPGPTPTVAAFAALAAFDLALRRRRPMAARAAIARARAAARRAGVPALGAEVERAGAALRLPAARLVARGEERPIDLDEVEALLASGALVVDGCRRAAWRGPTRISLARRPVLFALLRALAEGWPGEVTRLDLVRAAFGAPAATPSMRARLRVELGRLRLALAGLATVAATRGGYALAPVRTAAVVSLAPPVEGAGGAILALLADGAAWSATTLALSLGESPRTVQRALAALEEAGRVRGLGHGRARRWLSPPVSDFTTALLLPTPPGPG